MYWADSDAGTITRANLDGSQVETLVAGLDEPEGIAIDETGGKIYWTEEDWIGRANLDGSQVETLGTVSGRDLALDVDQGKIYVVNWRNVIYRTGLTGSPIETIVLGSVSYPTTNTNALALDLSRGKIYWASWSRSPGQDIRGETTLNRANLDGSQVEILGIVSGYIYDLAIDEDGGKIYWTGWDGVFRANLDGSQVETLFIGRSRGVALDIGGGKIYWTDDYDDVVWRANFDGSQVEIIVSGLGDPEDIALGP